MTSRWLSRRDVPQDVPWYTVQFYLDSESGDIDEVSYQMGTHNLRCTCSPLDPRAVCIHVALVDARRALTGMVQMDLTHGATEEVERLGLDIRDPDVLRDLLRRFGHIEVL